MGSLKEELARRAGISLEELERRAADKAAARRAADVSHEAEARARAHFDAAPRYPGAALMRPADVQALIDQVGQPPANAAVDGVFDPATWLGGRSVQLLRGPVELDGLVLPAEGSTLIVDGDLRVRGVLQQAFRAGGLLVRGTLAADHVVTTGEIAVTGDLVVGGTLVGNCTNYCTNVWGRTRAQTVISAKEHYFCCWGGLEAEMILDTEETPNLGARATALGDAVAGYLRDDVDLYDEVGVAEVLRAHGTLLAAPGSR